METQHYFKVLITLVFNLVNLKFLEHGKFTITLNL